MHGTALMAYGSKKDCLMVFGNRSVGARLVKIKANMASTTTVVFGFSENTHRAMPEKAMIKVGDSALWLKITIQIKRAENHINR